VAWAGDVSAVILIAVRTWRLIVNPDSLHEEHAQEKAME